MRKLAIIGASYLQLPLLQKAKEMGIETHCFAWEKGAVCREIADFFYPISIIEKELILEACQGIHIDGIASIASEVAVPTVSFVAEKMGLIANTYTTALTATNKFLMRQQFSKFGLPSPRYINVTEDYSISDFHFPVIVKPVDRSGSRGVMKVKKKEDLNMAIERAKKISFTHQVIIEEYIEGTEISVETISWKGKHFILAITDKITSGEPYFVELEHHQPTQLDKTLQLKIREKTKQALTALGIIYGASHAEFKITNDGEVFVIEIGARMGGDFIGSDLVQLCTGYDFLKGVIDVSLDHFEEPILANNEKVGICFLSEETKQVLPLITNANNYKEIVKAEITLEELHNIECSADRSGYFIYTGEKPTIESPLEIAI